MYDGFVMKLVIEKIAEKINGMNIRNIYLSRNVLYFSFDSGDLKISLNPNFSYISFVEHFVKDPERNSFVDLLRSRIRGAKVVNFANIEYERSAILELKRVDEIGVVHNYKMYFDIMGKHSNAIFTENDGILDAFRRVETSVRKIFPGERFVPYDSSKVNIDSFSDVDFLIKLVHDYKHRNKTISEFIYSSIQGFSKATAQEVLYRADLEDTGLEEITDEDVEKLFNALLAVRSEIQSKLLWLYYENNNFVDVSAIKLHRYNDERECNDVIKCINEYFDYVETKDRLTQKRHQLLSVVKGKIVQNEELIEKLKKEITECQQAEMYRKYGELLKAYSYQIDHGTELAQLYDWESNSYVNVPMEKNLTPIENSVRYFNIYSKLKRKARGIEERKDILERELSYLQQLQLTIESAESFEELAEIEDEMIESELIKRKLRNSKKGIQPSEPRKYIYNGFTILVGKNNKQNDELVKKASDSDIWLHVQGMPGAHVVIKTNGKSIDEDTLLYAARLAATYSKGRYSTNVPVDYTYAKYVKKPKGFKPGLVLYSNFKTLFVDPFDRT
ncbi:MAG: Rqc2 family fibronectin-binding protein [Fervidobacterium sp.]